jgi:CubicO group peptidase (beta-lactamase class C family)
MCNSIENKLSKLMVVGVLLCSFAFSGMTQNQQIETLINAVENLRLNAQTSAALVIVVDADKVLINHNFGIVDWDTKEAFDSSHHFRIGSISKSFAGLLALRMQQKGLIDLQDRFDKHVKTYVIDNKFTDSPIRLEHLLEHTAGLSDLTKSEWDYNDSEPIGIQAALALKKGQHKALWQPGQHHSYSNVGAGLLGLALEKASGKTYEQLMKEFVFNPLDMQSSTLLLSNQVKKNLITGYNTDGKTKIPYWHNIYRPFAAINSTSNDMINFLQMLLNKGRIKSGAFLSETKIKRFESPQTNLSAKNKMHFGYGLGNYSWQNQGYVFHGHGGDADGYLTKYGYNREAGKAYFIMINSFQHNTRNRIQNLVESFIINDLAKPHYPTRLKLDEETAKKYSGKYTQMTKRFGRSSNNQPSLEVYEKQGQLYLRHKTYSSQILFAVTNNNFRFSDESVATMSFVKDQEKLYLQSDFGNFIKVTN